MTRLQATLHVRHAHYRGAIDVVRGSVDDVPALGDVLPLLREATELTAVLRRLIPHLTIQQLYDAFGPPGNWGYDTPLGDALITIYRAGEDV